jgi:hypothetical protein
MDDACPQVAGGEIASIDHSVEMDDRFAGGIGAVSGDHAERDALGCGRRG